ncbi:transcriptional activator hap3 [Basidiobolus ranarum]|uniref:Transcriptional activator hap3 n=1 Tax=Basidiobolus ranarum TaxID=34480 RepID=A0ABR2VZ13_9FUNG
MQSLGFENYAEVLKVYLSKYRETIKVDKGSGNYKDEDGGETSGVLFQQPPDLQQQHHMHPQHPQYPQPNYYANATYPPQSHDF